MSETAVHPGRPPVRPLNLPAVFVRALDLRTATVCPEGYLINIGGAAGHHGNAVVPTGLPQNTGWPGRTTIISLQSYVIGPLSR